MKKLVPSHIESIVPYKPGKPVKELERELGITGSIKLASNENPLGPSPSAVRAMQAEMSTLHRYPDGSSYELRTRLSKFLGVPTNEIIVGAGSNEILDLLFRTFVCPNDEVVIGNPSFVYYAIGLQAANARYKEVPLEDGLYWSVDALLGAVGPATKMLVVANPNNPTGTALDSRQVARLLNEAPQEVMVVLDEAYAEYASADRWGNGLALRPLRENLVVLRTFSKAYGLAGVRVGYGVAPARCIEFLNRVRLPFNTSSLAQAAAVAALDDQEHVEKCVALNRSEHDRLRARLQTEGYESVASEANFVLVNTGRNGRDVCEALLKQGVIVRPVPPPLDSYLRVTIGLPEENDRFIEALKHCL